MDSQLLGLREVALVPIAENKMRDPFLHFVHGISSKVYCQLLQHAACILRPVFRAIVNTDEKSFEGLGRWLERGCGRSW